MVGSCEGMLRLCGLVASEGKRSIDSACNDFGNARCGSRLSVTTQLREVEVRELEPKYVVEVTKW